MNTTSLSFSFSFCYYYTIYIYTLPYNIKLKSHSFGCGVELSSSWDEMRWVHPYICSISSIEVVLVHYWCMVWWGWWWWWLGGRHNSTLYQQQQQHHNFTFFLWNSTGYERQTFDMCACVCALCYSYTIQNWSIDQTRSVESTNSSNHISRANIWPIYSMFFIV